MRILHVGWGFSPWRPGGLIAYAHDLMDAQVDDGHQVEYFFSGRHYPYVRGPRLKRWQLRGVVMHEVVNPPVRVGLEAGTRRPDQELSEPWIEGAFRGVLEASRPDVIHIQELLGLPSSLIEIAADAGVPTVMTLQDYQPLCTTLRLFDTDERVCMRRDVGVDCVNRNAIAPADASQMISMTLHYEYARLQERLRLDADPWLVRAVIRRVSNHAARRDRDVRAPDNRALAAAYQRRRDVNVARLNRVSRLVAQSPRVGEIYRTLGVSGERMMALPFTLAHIERLRPRSFAAAPERVTFASLNSGGHPSKGSKLIVRALRLLRAEGLEGAFNFRWLGYVDGAQGAELEAYENVELVGPYRPEQLDTLLADVDVGVVPSIWEEAFGYAGLELVAKGIPLIANPIGGIVEYARDGETAWLNSSRSAEELAALMSQLVREPQLIVDMHERLMGVRDRLVTPMRGHIEAIEELYRELVARPGPPAEAIQAMPAP